MKTQRPQRTQRKKHDRRPFSKFASPCPLCPLCFNLPSVCVFSNALVERLTRVKPLYRAIFGIPQNRTGSLLRVYICILTCYSHSQSLTDGCGLSLYSPRTAGPFLIGRVRAEAKSCSDPSIAMLAGLDRAGCLRASQERCGPSGSQVRVVVTRLLSRVHHACGQAACSISNGWSVRVRGLLSRPVWG